MMRKRLIGIAAFAAAAALTLTACSSGTLSGDETKAPETDGPTELTKVTVGLLPIAPAAAVQLGIDEGIFEKHGLEIAVETGQGGAALLPAVSSGTIEFAVGNPQSVLVAASQGLPMNIIAGYSAITD
ncbi:MAG TPA: ABC transporter substrate-binding protein, partial [Microbacterium sp.]|nr:ABC transporter substrate-binding protein [Microbacterium sp.]